MMNRNYINKQPPYAINQQEFRYPYSQPGHMNMTTQQFPQMNYQPNLGYQLVNGDFPYSFNNQIQNQQGMYSHFQAPYPINYQMPAGQPTGIQSFMSQFKTENGTYDYNKMMDTAGQMMGAVNQISGLVKGFSSVFKS